MILDAIPVRQAGIEPTLKMFIRHFRTTSPLYRLERVTRIELALSAWKAEVPPQHFTRKYYKS